jgi:type II secretory pathway pseudopilin PulG
MSKRPIPEAGRRQKGFTYLGLMFLIVMLTAGLALVGQVWHTSMLREKEKELLFVGDQFRRAIGQYYAANAGRNERYPKTLEELLQDRNQPATRRYLRRIYSDPLTGKAEWGLIRQPNGGITGVYSLATGMPVKRVKFPRGYEGFDLAATYADWAFVYAPGSDAIETAAAQPVPAPVSPPPAAQEPAPEPVAQTPAKPRLRRLCETVASNDAAACAQQAERWGSALECVQSAQLRQAVCQAGEPLPALNIRYL